MTKKNLAASYVMYCIHCNSLSAKQKKECEWHYVIRLSLEVARKWRLPHGSQPHDCRIKPIPIGSY